MRNFLARFIQFLQDFQTKAKKWLRKLPSLQNKYYTWIFYWDLLANQVKIHFFGTKIKHGNQKLRALILYPVSAVIQLPL